MKKIIACIVLTCAAAAARLPAQDMKVSQLLDWPGGRVVVEVTRALDLSTPSLVRAKSDAETDLEQRLPEALARALGPLVIDSSHVLSDYAVSDASLSARLNDIALGAQRTDLSLTGDFSALVAHYSVPFFGERGIGKPFFPSRAVPIRRRLGDVTTRVYTGLLIFARGMLPAAGGDRVAAARPALFPRIWDEKMNLVLDRGMCAPESLARWGMVGYSDAVDDPSADLRVGNVPLRLAARGVFGDYSTDIIISMDGANQLLALPGNIALLREGRIVIVYDTLR
jgi:hypothetical protein